MAKKLLDILRDTIRMKHYSYRTEQVYVGWIKRYILYHNKKHPKDMGKIEIEQFLTFLAVENKVSASTQNQAFNSILFLYKEILAIDLKDQNIQALRAKERKHIPVVLSIEKVKTIILHTKGIYQIMLELMHPKGISSF